MIPEKTFFVTGGAGFSGSYLCENLIKKGHRVVIVDNLNEFYAPETKWHNINEIRVYLN